MEQPSWMYSEIVASEEWWKMNGKSHEWVEM